MQLMPFKPVWWVLEQYSSRSCFLLELSWLQLLIGNPSGRWIGLVGTGDNESLAFVG